MSWNGIFKKLRPGDLWSEEDNVVGVLVHNMGDGTHETVVAREFVEDDGKPFEEGDEIEILIRRVGSDA